jgi:hypothetical protein
MKLNRKTAGLAVLVTAAALTLTACEPGRECLEGHTELRPTVKTVTVNGKTRTEVKTESVYVCDRYAEPTPTTSETS